MSGAERQVPAAVDTQSDFEVRHERPGEQEAIVALLQSVFDGWPHFDLGCPPLDHWNWKYRDNPVGSSMISLLVKQDRLVGCSHGIPLHFAICGRTYNGNLATDIGIHPDFRSSGLSKPLRRHLRESVRDAGYHFSIFFTTSPILYRTFSRDRPRFPHRILNLVRVGDVDRQLQAIPVDNPALMRQGFFAAAALNRLQNLWRGARYRARARGPGPSVRPVDGFDERIDDFCRQVHGHYQFMVERSREYLDWRYGDPRAGNYRIALAEEAGRVLGYSVVLVNRFRPEYPIGYIIDLLTLPGRPDAARALVADAVQHFDGAGVNLVCCQVPAAHDTRDALHLQGFLDSRFDLTLFFGRVTMPHNAPQLMAEIESTEPRRVHFCYGDVDSVPVGVPGYLRAGSAVEVGRR